MCLGRKFEMTLLCNQGMNNQTLWSRERFHEVWMCGRDFHTAERAHIISSSSLSREMVLDSKLISREWLLWPRSSDPHRAEGKLTELLLLIFTAWISRVRLFCFRQKWEVITFKLMNSQVDGVRMREILFIHPAIISGPP